jgi:glyoxylase-like metal-dependent hydrolase (beta-lactamase superfamily II)
MRVGSFEILPVIDGEMRVPPTAAFASTTEGDWAPHRGLLGDDGMLGLALGGFLIRGGPDASVVLVDLGLGHFEMMGQRLGGKLLENLASHGLSPADVTDVMFSHLHLDHVGWASEEGNAVFPNATYRCDQRDWDYWIDGPEDAIAGVPVEFAALQKQAIGPIGERTKTWSANGAVLPGISVMHAPGHTPGSAVVVVSSGTERAMLLGDAVHCPVELLEDEWAGLGDVDPDLARRTRVALAREIEGKDMPISAAHFPGLSFGRLLKGEGRRRWVV